MAKQLYDYWFVQFDFPDENGMPYKSSGGKMVWNEKLKREIPQGWFHGSLLDIANYTNGLACQKFRPTDERKLPVIKIKEMHDGFSSETEYVTADISESVKVYDGDVLFSWSASLEVMLWACGNGGLNQHIFKVTSKNGYPKSFYYYQLLNYIAHFKRMAEARKTTMGHITQEHLQQSIIVLPPDLTIPNQLEVRISPIFEQIVLNNQEIIKLTRQRDELLPLLMNGQVSVKQLNNDLASHILLPYMFFTHKRLYLYGLNITHMKEPGYVYILTNPSFKEDWVKIGKSSRPVNVRSKELDNTAVPLPFEIFATIRTVKFNEVEKLIHKTIDRLTDLRIRQNREFFNIQPQIALDILRDISTTIDDAFIELYHNNQPIKEAAEVQDEEPHKRRAPFRFSLVNIQIGETVVFTPKNIKVKVASDNQVEYEGRIYKLSPFTAAFLPDEMRNASDAYQGPKYFTYNGRPLDELRKELEDCQ